MLVGLSDTALTGAASTGHRWLACGDDYAPDVGCQANHGDVGCAPFQAPTSVGSGRLSEEFYMI